MENSPEELIEEIPNANLPLNIEQINENSEENEVLPQSVGAEVEGEKMDEISGEETCQGSEVAEEPCDKHIEGEVFFIVYAISSSLSIPLLELID
jgi:hypothetical protein